MIRSLLETQQGKDLGVRTRLELPQADSVCKNHIEDHHHYQMIRRHRRIAPIDPNTRIFRRDVVWPGKCERLLLRADVSFPFIVSMWEMRSDRIVENQHFWPRKVSHSSMLTKEYRFYYISTQRLGLCEHCAEE